MNIKEILFQTFETNEQIKKKIEDDEKAKEEQEKLQEEQLSEELKQEAMARRAEKESLKAKAIYEKRNEKKPYIIPYANGTRIQNLSEAYIEYYSKKNPNLPLPISCEQLDKKETDIKFKEHIETRVNKYNQAFYKAYKEQIDTDKYKLNVEIITAHFKGKYGCVIPYYFYQLKIIKK